MLSSIKSPTQALVSTLGSLSFDQLPADVVDRSKELLLDHLGVSLYGATFEWCRILRETIEQGSGNKESSIYGAGRTSARDAALVNGTAGHAIELDDTHDESLSHPGAVVFSAAVATAEASGRSGADLLVGAVAGYEAQCRIGAALGKTLLRRGIHPTAHLGAFGAAAATSRLLQLTSDQMTWAFGLAGSMASGIMKFTQDPQGTMIKRLHAGMPAERGILAAQLASRGFTGPRNIIEGDFGYATTFAEGADLSRITRNLGEVFEISKISVKLYPCCRLFHALIEAIAECRASPSFSPAKIKQIKVFGPANMIDGHFELRPQSTMSAQYSLPFTTAVALLADPSDPANFEDDARRRSDFLQMADKVAAAADPELEAVYPQKLPGRVQIKLHDGNILESVVLDSRSTPANPINRSDVVAKFKRLTSGLLSPVHQDDIIHCVMTLDSAPNTSRLASLLRSS
jgi:2-methylcitrate dehydratase PrpD